MTNRYLDCSDYKNASRCFIATVVCLTMGKSDCCEELTVMRAFRDNWLRNQPDGPTLIEEYYAVAPGIVEKIDALPERKAVYADIYERYIMSCVQNAKRQCFEESKRIYTGMVSTLKTLYSPFISAEQQWFP